MSNWETAIWTTEFPTQDGVYRTRLGEEKETDTNEVGLAYGILLIVTTADNGRVARLIDVPNPIPWDKLEKDAAEYGVQFHGPLVGPHRLTS